MRKLILAVLMFFLLTHPIKAKAGMVTGETPLGGFSYYLDKYYSSDRAYSQEDLDLLANVMYHENYCNGDYVMYLTGCVVLNRVDHCSWCPNTIKGVLYAKGQYATVPKFYTAKIPKKVYRMAATLLITRSTIPHNVVFQAMFPQGSSIYYEYNGEYFCYE